MSNGLFSSKQAAYYLNVSDSSMRISRITGKLCGVDAPTFKKIGTRKIVYSVEDLNKWIQALPSRQRVG